jgi:hypothetical protein
MVTDSLPTTETKPAKLRWLHPTPGRLLVVLLAVEAGLLLSERWLPRGYAVLIAIAGIAVTMVLTLFWWLFALCFRWRFQFSLRSLMALTVAVAIPCSWLAVEMKAAREQREAVEAISKLNDDGAAYYDHEVKSLGISGGRRLSESKFLLHLFGVDFFHSVLYVTLSSYDPDHMDHPIHRISEDDVSCLDRLKNLKGLELRQQPIGDETLAHLKIFPDLEELDIAGTRITDAGLMHLKNLTHLQRLYLSNTKIDDAGLEHLKGLPQLQTLFLDDTKVTQEGLDKLMQALPPHCKVYH